MPKGYAFNKDCYSDSTIFKSIVNVKVKTNSFCKAVSP